jgi:myo-inositol-1(or 4)-monophosphatase
MTTQTLDLAAALQQTIQIAQSAGALLREHFARPRKALNKSSVIDLVTEADKQSEALIVSHLREIFPAHQIVGEEGGAYAQEGETADYRWFVDPLDGTTNFAHGLPIFSVSMALTGSDGKPVLAVVYDPTRDETFAAAKGLGATLNDQAIQVSETESLGAALVISGFPYDKWTTTENNLENWSNFVVRTQGERRLGSAALDLCYVAAGRADGYWEGKLHQWDMMAGALIVTEAGGRVTDYEGGTDLYGLKRPFLVSSNGHIHEEMLEVIRLGKDAPRP